MEGMTATYTYSNGVGCKVAKTGFIFSALEAEVQRAAAALGVGPAVYSADEAEIQMEHVEGVLHKDTIMTDTQAYDYGVKLRSLHDAGIVHCDLHAGNVIITGNTITIIDYGFSRFNDGSPEDLRAQQADYEQALSDTRCDGVSYQFDQGYRHNHH